MTVTEHDDVILEPSADVTKIVAEPDATAVTRPDDDTDAIDVLEDDHVIALFVAFDGAMVTCN